MNFHKVHDLKVGIGIDDEQDHRMIQVSVQTMSHGSVEIALDSHQALRCAASLLDCCLQMEIQSGEQKGD